MQKIWQAIGDFLVGLIYPPFCVRCGRIGTLFCDRCHTHLNFITTKNLVPSLFRDEKNPVYLENVTALCVYDAVLKKVLHQYKYGGVRDLFRPLAYWLYEFASWDADIITYIPIHKKRKVERGYNQAQLLAGELSRLSGIPCVSLLARPVYKQKQALSKNKAERLAKTKNIFTARENDLDRRLRVLIIDDVVTSGATLNEAARILHDAGFQHIQALAVAHGD